MQRVFIMEGPDSCGKTEIGKELANVYNMSYFKNIREHKNFISNNFINSAFVEAFYAINLLKQVQFKENGIIFDRHIPSEYVYSKVFNRETNEEVIWHIDDELANLGAVTIYCYKDFYNTYNDSLIELSRIEELKREYENYLIQTSMDFCRLNTDDENLSRQITDLKYKL